MNSSRASSDVCEALLSLYIEELFRFASLTNGTNYLQEAVWDTKSKQMEINITRVDYVPLSHRVPCATCWPGVIKPGTIDNNIYSHEDMLPTLLAAAGVPDVKEQVRKGMQVGAKTFKVHLDGYNITDTLAGKASDPRHDWRYMVRLCPPSNSNAGFALKEQTYEDFSQSPP